MSISVKVSNVFKKYKLYKKTSDKILDITLPKGYGKEFYALQSVSFEANKGDIIGVIGVNGAGKSTLSNIISGVIKPSSGTVEISGEVALISIAAGLNNQLTGRENIELKCLMLGFNKRQIKRIMPEIIDFSEIGDFIDQPVKKYSSGMKSRLGFAISVSINPDILIIDEALSVGDKTFADKCLNKMNEFKASGKTIFFISHSIGQVKEFCNKALWLEAGEIKKYGEIKDIIPKYEQFLRDFSNKSPNEKEKFKMHIRERQKGLDNVELKKEDLEKSTVTQIKKTNRLKSVNKRVFLNAFLIIFVAIGLLYIVNNSLLNNKELPFFSSDSQNENVLPNIATKNSNVQEEMNSTPVDQEAFISTKQADLYFDSSLTYKISDLSFATLIYIEEKTETSFLVKVNDISGYINIDEAVLLVDSLNKDVRSIEEVFPILPADFIESYEYYLAFFGSDFEEIEETFVGAKSTYLDNGQLSIKYEEGNIEYLFDGENTATSIVISDIFHDVDFLNDIKDMSSVVSSDNTQFLLDFGEYTGILNLDDKKLLLKVAK
ncbi:MAG: teichoic acids export ABC transporter ATP-binding subunit TagH [Bacillota bacterium]|nr:teichoic acids export ABC transporter ATP-binding subunit TagH [Bacillota bacterium]